MGDNSNENSDESRENVRLQRDDHLGFGISVVGGELKMGEAQFSPIVIARVVSASPADMCGKLSIGCILLGINQTSFEGLSREETVSALIAAPSASILHFRRPRYQQRKGSAAYLPPRFVSSEAVMVDGEQQRARAMHAFHSEHDDELSIAQGDIIRVLKKGIDGWWLGERLQDNKVGVFPGNFVSAIRIPVVESAYEVLPDCIAPSISSSISDAVPRQSSGEYIDTFAEGDETSKLESMRRRESKKRAEHLTAEPVYDYLDGEQPSRAVSLNFDIDPYAVSRPITSALMGDGSVTESGTKGRDGGYEKTLLERGEESLVDGDLTPDEKKSFNPYDLASPNRCDDDEILHAPAPALAPTTSSQPLYSAVNKARKRPSVATVNGDIAEMGTAEVPAPATIPESVPTLAAAQVTTSPPSPPLKRAADDMYEILPGELPVVDAPPIPPRR
jgi:hypothetical protein